MKTKFTPGPWKVYEPYNLEKNTYGIDSMDEYVVVWMGLNKEQGIRKIYDAHLIAAAPDLYEALETVLQAIESGDVVSGVIGEAKQALAKARGEK